MTTEPAPKLDVVVGTVLERAFLACVTGNEKPVMALYKGRVWTLNPDGETYDSRPITDEDCV